MKDNIQAHDWFPLFSASPNKHRFLLANGVQVCFYNEWNVSSFMDATRAQIDLWTGTSHTSLEISKGEDGRWSQLEQTLYCIALAYWHGERHRRDETLKFLGVKQ